MAFSLEALIPVLSAILLACLGYWKNRPEEDFNQLKFLRTIIVGILVGVVQIQLNLTPASAEGWVTMFLVSTGVIDIIIKFIEGLGKRGVAPTLLT